MEICTGICVDITDLLNGKESNKLNSVYELYFPHIVSPSPAMVNMSLTGKYTTNYTSL